MTDDIAGSGDRAVAAAIERAKETAGRNIPVFEDLPVPPDTANLRLGANLHDALLALLPLVGVWRGEGEGRGPHGDYRFGQQIIVSHDGGDYLNWEARSWRLDEGVVRVARPARDRLLAVRRRPQRRRRVPGHRTAAGALRRLHRTLLRPAADPVLLGTGYRCAGPQQVRNARRRRQAVVRDRRWRRSGLRRRTGRRRRRPGPAPVRPAVTARGLNARTHPRDGRCGRTARGLHVEPHAVGTAHHHQPRTHRRDHHPGRTRVAGDMPARTRGVRDRGSVVLGPPAGVDPATWDKAMKACSTLDAGPRAGQPGRVLAASSDRRMTNHQQDPRSARFRAAAHSGNVDVSKPETPATG